MPRPKSKVESGLLKKGFQESEGDHHYFIYFTQDGKKTGVKTKTSHTKKMKDIPDNLLGQMAKQCYLAKQQFLDLIDCPLTQEDYEKILQVKAIINTSDTSPFPQTPENNADTGHPPKGPTP